MGQLSIEKAEEEFENLNPSQKFARPPTNFIYV